MAPPGKSLTVRRRTLGVIIVISMGIASTGTPSCPGEIFIAGHGSVSLVPTGWGLSEETADLTKVPDRSKVVAHMGSRAYFANTCTAGAYDNNQYLGMNLLGKTLRYTTDLSTAGCGCNAAFYLTSMRHNKHKSECLDHYCDANNVCGCSCTEIDIQEGNQYAWHTTVHTEDDASGMGKGYGGGGPGWNGPRTWNDTEYGPTGRCINTYEPFQVSVSFPVDEHGILSAMQLVLSQEGRPCDLSLTISNYSGSPRSRHNSTSKHSGMRKLTKALEEGMTPIASYWRSDDMLWLDGEGDDKDGPCHKDHKKKCGESVQFYDFHLEDLKITTTQAPPPTQPPMPTQPIMHGILPAMPTAPPPRGQDTADSDDSDHVVLVVEAREADLPDVPEGAHLTLGGSYPGDNQQLPGKIDAVMKEDSGSEDEDSLVVMRKYSAITMGVLRNKLSTTSGVITAGLAMVMILVTVSVAMRLRSALAIRRSTLPGTEAGAIVSEGSPRVPRHRSATWPQHGKQGFPSPPSSQSLLVLNDAV